MSISRKEQRAFELMIGAETFDFGTTITQHEALRDILKIHLSDLEFGTSLYMTTAERTQAFMFVVSPWQSVDEERTRGAVLCQQRAGRTLAGLDEDRLFIATGAGMANQLLSDETSGVVLQGYGLVYQPVLDFMPQDMTVRDTEDGQYALRNFGELQTTDIILTAGVKGPHGKPVNIF